jgi:hypothetical protein
VLHLIRYFKPIITSHNKAKILNITTKILMCLITLLNLEVIKGDPEAQARVKVENSRLFYCCNISVLAMTNYASKVEAR